MNLRLCFFLIAGCIGFFACNNSAKVTAGGPGDTLLLNRDADLRDPRMPVSTPATVLTRDTSASPRFTGTPGEDLDPAGVSAHTRPLDDDRFDDHGGGRGQPKHAKRGKHGKHK